MEVLRLKSLRHNILSQKRNLWEFGWILSFSKDEISLNSCENKSWKVYLDCSPRRKTWPPLCSWSPPGNQTAVTTAAGLGRAKPRSSSLSEVTTASLQVAGIGIGPSTNGYDFYIFWLSDISWPDNDNKVELDGSSFSIRIERNSFVKDQLFFGILFLSQAQRTLVAAGQIFCYMMTFLLDIKIIVLYAENDAMFLIYYSIKSSCETMNGHVQLIKSGWQWGSVLK